MKEHIVGTLNSIEIQSSFEKTDSIFNEFIDFKRRDSFYVEPINSSVIFKHIRYAYDWAFESYAIRRKVGSVIFKNGHPLSSGYNGMPSGENNKCEIDLSDGTSITRKEVIHAERNAFYKVKSPDDTENSSMFVTTAPCFECSQEIFMRKVSKVYFSEIYRGIDGVEYLIKRGVSITYVDLKNGVIEDIYVSDSEQSIDLKIRSIESMRKKFVEGHYPVSVDISDIYKFVEKKK